MADHRATWVRLRDIAREHFPDDELAAEIAMREAFDAEESAAYTANLDVQVDDQGILEAAHAATRLWEELRYGRRASMPVAMTTTMTSTSTSMMMTWMLTSSLTSTFPLMKKPRRVYLANHGGRGGQWRNKGHATQLTAITWRQGGRRQNSARRRRTGRGQLYH
jgi:hypothetical protein